MPTLNFIGEVSLFAFGFAPSGWMLCAGQTLNIHEHSALFSVIGVTYGGDGHTTFKLPNLQDRVVAGEGQPFGLPRIGLGERLGDARVGLGVNQLPPHSHEVMASNAGAGDTDPEGRVFGKGSESGPPPSQVSPYTAPDPGNEVTMSGRAVSETGGGQPHENRQPFLVLRYCICIDGVYPRRP